MAEVTNGNKLINYQNLADFKEQIDIHYSPSTHGHGNITSAGTITGAASKVVVTDGNGKIAASSDITTTELGYLNNVSGNIQTQLNGKAASSHSHGNISSVGVIAGAASRVVVTDANGKITSSSTIDTTELGYLNGVTGNIQTQLNGKSDTGHTHDYAPKTHTHGNITSAGTITGAADRVVVTDANGKITSSSTITTTELGYLNDVSANIQTQINDKAPTVHTATTTTYGAATTSAYGHVKLSTGNCSSTYTAGVAAASKHSHSDATTGASGYMSSDDKKKLDGIAAGADAVAVTAHTTSGTKVATIKVNSSTYEIKVSASDLGVSDALHFIGEATTTAPTSGTYKSFTHGTTQLYIRVTTAGTAAEVDMLAGDVFIYSGKEFICTTPGKNGTNVCKEFGDEGSFVLKTYEVKGTTDLEGGGKLTGTTEIKHKEVLGSAKTSIGGVSNGTITVPIVSANKYGHITALTSTTITPTTSAFTTIKVGSTSIVADAKHDELTLSAGTNITITPDAGNDKITISATNTYHKTVYTAGTKIATGVSNQDIFVPVATSDIGGAIKIGYSENGKNYPVELDSNNKAFVNVPWTDNNTHNTSKNVICSGATVSGNTAASNGSVYINHIENSTVTSSHEISGKGATTVTCDANGNITISSSDNYHKAMYTTGTKIASGVSSQDIYVPVATSSIAGAIKIGYGENGKNYPVELDSSGKAFVNVPWTDTDTNTHYTSKNVVCASATGTTNAAATNGNVYLNHLEESTVKSSNKISGAGATTVTCDANGNIIISSTDSNTDNYHKTVYSAGTKIATGVTNHDIYVPIASSSIAGAIKVGYSENGKNYPVELDSNGNAFVNVPWTDTDKNDNDWYTNKLIATSSATQTGIASAASSAYINNLVYNKTGALSGLSSSIQVTGGGGVKVSVTTAGVVRVSAASQYKTGLYVTSGTGTGNTSHGCGSDSSTHRTVDMKLFDSSTLRNTISFSGSNICLNAVNSSVSATTISMWAPGCTKTEIDALFA